MTRRPSERRYYIICMSCSGHRSVDYKTSKCEDRSWTSSSQQRWSVLGFTQYGSSCLEKDDDDYKNLSASLICVQLNLCSGKVHTHVFSNQPADSGTEDLGMSRII